MIAPSRFDDLLRLWRDGEASVEELSELEALLRSDARYRRSLARSLRLEVDLYGRFEVAAGARAAAAPPARRWKLESVAAVLAVAVSLVAAGAFLLRAPGGRVESGAIRVNDAAAGVFEAGDRVEAIGPAALRFKDGSGVVLDPGAAGTFVAPGRFDLRRGGGSFVAGPALRVDAPDGSVSAAGAAFSARFDDRGLRVAVESGTVEVEYDGLRHALRAGDRVKYLPRTGRTADAREAMKRAGEATIDAATAIEKALPGIPVGASLDREDGQVEFLVRVVRDGRLREVTLDPKTGTVLDDDGEDGDRSALVAAMKIPLLDALKIALAKVPGVAMEADAELKDGRAWAEIEILSNGRLYEVTVDLGTGAVLSVGPDTP